MIFILIFSYWVFIFFLKSVTKMRFFYGCVLWDFFCCPFFFFTYVSEYNKLNDFWGIFPKPSPFFSFWWLWTLSNLNFFLAWYVKKGSTCNSHCLLFIGSVLSCKWEENLNTLIMQVTTQSLWQFIVTLA